MDPRPLSRAPCLLPQDTWPHTGPPPPTPSRSLTGESERLLHLLPALRPAGERKGTSPPAGPSLPGFPVGRQGPVTPPRPSIQSGGQVSVTSENPAGLAPGTRPTGQGACRTRKAAGWAKTLAGLLSTPTWQPRSKAPAGVPALLAPGLGSREGFGPAGGGGRGGRGGRGEGGGGAAFRPSPSRGPHPGWLSFRPRTPPRETSATGVPASGIGTPPVPPGWLAKRTGHGDPAQVSGERGRAHPRIGSLSVKRKASRERLEVV